MYRKWTIEDIRKEIEIIESKLNYPCNIPIEISSRAIKRVGAFFFRKEANKVKPIKFVFAKKLIQGNYPENIVKEVIIHEYLHYYCDTKTNKSNGHNKLFKDMCRSCGISPEATFKYEDPNKKKTESYTKEYKIYCSTCGKLVCVHKRKDAVERKIKNYISKCCKAKLICNNNIYK